MSVAQGVYCLDANVLIQAWQKYYSPKFCPDYWNVLVTLGTQGIVFLPEAVFDEVARAEDELSAWLKDSKLPVKPDDHQVAECLKSIYAKDPVPKYLVDNTRQRSLADPWVIAHAMNENATVVTQEVKVTVPGSKRIKIPNVCENMGIRCINDFQLIDELGIRFACELAQSNS